MVDPEKRRSAVEAVAWSFIERFSKQVVGFVIGIFLARLLSPSDYGTIGMMALFLSLSNTFIDSGFANALIRKPDRSEEDLSTAFYFNIIVGAFFAIGLIFCAPLIAAFFKTPILTTLVRIAALNLFINSFCIVQVAILNTALNVQAQTMIALISQVPTGLLAIFLAYRGCGVYALSVQSIASTIISSSLLWMYARWRPCKGFSWESFKYLWNFGSRLLGANLIGCVFDNLYSFLIGRFYTSAELGLYSKASSLTEHVSGTTTGIVMRAALPILSRYQADNNLLRERFRLMMKLMVFAIAPISAWLFFSGTDIIVMLWSDKWCNAGVLFQPLLVGSMFVPISNLSLTLFQVKGRTDITLKLELPKKLIYCVLIGIGFYNGVYGLACAWMLVNVVGAVINIRPTSRLLEYSCIRQSLDLLGYMILAYALGFVMQYVRLFDCAALNVTLRFLALAGCYVGVLLMLRDHSVMHIFNRLIVRRFEK